MRKGVLIVGVLTVLAVVVFFWSRARTGEGSPVVDESPTDVTHDPRERTQRGGTVNAAAAKSPSVETQAAEADGVFEVHVTEGGRPVSGAAIRIYLRGAEDPNTSAIAWRVAGTRVSSEDGIARVPAKPGAYLLAVRAPGFAPARRIATRPIGELVTRVQVALARGVSLRGRTVVKTSHQSVPLAELTLTPETSPVPWIRDSAPVEEQTFGKSDGRGDFEIGGLAPGRYTLETVAVGYARLSRRTVRAPSSDLLVELSSAGFMEGYVLDDAGNPVPGATVTASGLEEPVSSTTGEGGGFSLEVGGGSFHVSAKHGTQSGAVESAVTVAAGATRRGVVIHLGTSSALEGTVTAESTGNGIAGASIAVSPFRAAGDSGRAAAGPEGRFRIEGLAPGEYDVVITADGYSEVFRRGITVTPGQSFPLEVKMSGTAGVEGQVKGSDGSPLSGVRVKGRGSSDLTNLVQETSTDADGKYLLSGLSLGRSVVTASRGDESFSVNQWADLKEGPPAQIDFVLPDNATLTGYVSSHSGAALDAAVSVIATRQGGGAGWVRNSAAVEMDGRYNLDLAPGTYRVAALGANFAEVRPKFSSVTLEAHQTARLDLSVSESDSASSITGTALEPDGSPSPGAIVFVGASPASMNTGAVCDADGRFALRSNPSGLVILRAANGGRSGEIASVSPDARNVTIHMTPGATLRGRVVSSGDAVEAFSLQVVEDSGQSEGRSFAGDRFTVPEVPVGHVRISARTSDGRSGTADVTTTSGSSVDVEVPVGAGGTSPGG